MGSIATSGSGVFSRPVQNYDDLALWTQEAIKREQLRYRAIWLGWLRNILAFHGEDDRVLTENLTLQQRISPVDEKALDRIHQNFVLPHVRTMAAKLKQARPIFECDPATSEDADVLAAETGDRMLRAEWYQQDLDRIDTERLIWQSLTGTGYIHQYFDRRKGEPVAEGLFQGQIAAAALDPFKTYLEPHRRNVDKCRWGIVRERFPRDEVLETYEEDYHARTGEMLSIAPGDTVKSDNVADAYLEVAGVRGTGVDDSDYVDIDLVYHLPTKWYPNGRYAVVCGHKVLYEGPYPYPFLHRLPFLMFREVLCPWRLHGETGTSEVLRVQNLYNRIRKIEVDYHLDNLNSKWKKHKSTRVKTGALRSRSNAVITWSGDIEPKREPGLQIPGGIYTSLELCHQELQQAGLTDASQAMNPKDSSGRAILALQHQDDIRLGLTAIDAEPVYSMMGQNTLLMVKAFYSEPRRYKMGGAANQGGLWFFDKTDLGQTSDVRCVAGSALPFSKLARREEVKEQMGMGLLGQPGSPESLMRARRMLGQGLSEDIQDESAADAYVSERENLLMVQGQPMQVSEVDNHMMHLQSHVRKAKAPGVRDNPQILAVFIDHKRQHEAMMSGQPIQQPGQPSTPNPPGQPQPQPGQPHATTGPHGPPQQVATRPNYGGGAPAMLIPSEEHQ